MRTRARDMRKLIHATRAAPAPEFPATRTDMFDRKASTLLPELPAGRRRGIRRILQ